MQIDVSFLPAMAATFLLVFARIGTMLMLLPGLGEMSMPVRVRLSIALALAAMFFPLQRDAYTIDLQNLGQVLFLFGHEMIIGVILGMTARLSMAALQIAGAVVAQQMGLGFVTAVDPSMGQQNALVGTFLSMLAVTLIFATDLHYLVIAALNDSYRLFAPGASILVGDAAALITKTVAGAFRIGIQLSAPFLVFGLLFNLGLGVLSRLMPQMQVFFIGLPLSILLGFLILLAVIGAMMGTFIDFIGAILRELAPYS